MRRKSLKNPTEYFTDDIMEKLDAVAKQYFQLWNELRLPFSET